MKPGTSPPPHDGAAEASVLGAVLLGGSRVFAAARETLSSNDFYETRHQVLWLLLDRLSGEGSALDAITIRDAIDRNGTSEKVGGEAYLAELARAVPSEAGVRDYAAIVKRHSTARKVLASCVQLAEVARDPKALVELHARVTEEISYLREVLEDVGTKAVDLDAVAPRVKDLLAQPDPEQAWIIDRLLEEGGRLVLYGQSYIGKSLMAWEALRCVARGYGMVFNRGVEGKPCDAMLFYGENSRRQVKNAFRKLIAQDGCPEGLRVVEVHSQTPLPNLATHQGRAWYEAVVARLLPRLAVIDTSTSLVLADRSKSDVAGDVMTFLSSLGKKHGTAFIVVHHVRKASQRGDEGSHADKAYGAQEWIALADAAVLLEPDGQIDSGRVRVYPWKVRDAEGGKPYLAELDRETLRFDFVANLGSNRRPGNTSSGPEPALTPFQILEALRDLGPMTAVAVGEKFWVSTKTAKRRLLSNEFAGWLGSGVVVKDQTGSRSPDTYRFVGPMPV